MSTTKAETASRVRRIVNGCLLVAVLGCSRRAAETEVFCGRELVNSVGMTLVGAPAGEFMAGSDDASAIARGDGPRHSVVLTHGFWIGKYEVTQAEYQQVMAVNPSHSYSGGDGALAIDDVDASRYPVDRVTWEEAVEFCRRLSALPAEKTAGRTYRLPADAQWEYACRAGADGDDKVSEELSTQTANVSAPATRQTSALGRPASVGSYPANAWGLHDMHGNVWEWCQDGRRKYSSSSVVDPRGPEALEVVLRGGAWDYPAEYARSEHRQLALKGYVYFGFRVVCDTPAEADDLEATLPAG